MDGHILQQRPSLAGSTFSYHPPASVHQQHLRASLSRETFFSQQYRPHYRPRQPRTLPSQRNNYQAPQTAFPFPQQQQLLIMNSALNNEYIPFSPGYTSEDAKAILDSDFDDNNMFPLGQSTMPTTYHSSAYNMVAFRPLEPRQTFSPAVGPSQADAKINLSANTMQRTNTFVNAEQFESVELDEVMHAPIDASSPSTVNTGDDSPLTPTFDPHTALSDKHRWNVQYELANSQVHLAAAHPPYAQPWAPTAFGSFSSESSLSSYVASSASSLYVPRQYGQIQQPQTIFGINPQSTTHTGQATHAHFDPAYPAAETSGITYAEDLTDAAETESSDDDASAASSSSAGESALPNDRDQLLLDLRRQNLPYKEIKRVGGFTEAESTLRGRMRVLTKAKTERVRKPVWKPHDVTLLKKAVRKHSNRMSKGRPSAKLPWLKISKWLTDHGASYGFAPATCAKKWTEVGRRGGGD